MKNSEKETNFISHKMESQNDDNFSFHIKKQAVRNKKYFVYDHKEYPVDFDFLKKNSNYFFDNQDKYQNEQYINLIDESEPQIKLSEESIRAFISSCQNEPCTIRKSSVLPLQYLAHKFEFDELIQVTNQFIAQHSKELIFPTLFFKLFEGKEKLKQNPFFDTTKEEIFVSNHLNDFIKRDQMLSLPVPILYRIFKRCNSIEKVVDDLTIFLFKCLDKYGKSASILFNLVDFGDEKIGIINRLLQDYSDIFDFNMINKTLAKTTKQITSELSKQREEYSLLFSQMKEAFEQQRLELIQLKTEEKKWQEKEQEKGQIRIQIFLNEINKIKSDVDKKMKSIEDKFTSICKKQEEIIDSGAIAKYNQMILDTITIGQFVKFDDDLKEHFLNEVTKKLRKEIAKDKLENKILFFELALNDKFLNENVNSPVIQFIRDNNQQIEQITVKQYKLESIYSKGTLSSFLDNCIAYFDDILIEVNYPCNHNIIKIVGDYCTKNSNKIKISLSINNADYFKQKFQFNKCVKICKVTTVINSIAKGFFSDFTSLTELEFGMNVASIGNSLFRGCSSLKQIIIPSSVTSIGDYAFSGCSSLKQVTIPSSVTKIGEYCFDGCSELDSLTIDLFHTQFDITTFNNCTSLNNFNISTNDVNNRSNDRINIPFNMTDALYKSNIFNSSEFTSQINNFAEIQIEVKYPSNNFSNIYSNLVSMRNSYSNKVKINIFYSAIYSADTHFYNNNIINSVRFDSCVKTRFISRVLITYKSNYSIVFY